MYKNGDKYEGGWSCDLRHGLGTLWIYKEGKYYVRYNGEWQDGTPMGQGTYFEENGDSYEGGFVNGKRHGKGRALYGGRPTDGFGGDIYEGGFEDDKKHGPGTMMYGNGDIYEGSWANDQKHGAGSFFYMSKGRRYDGVWQCGVAKCGSYSEIHQAPPGAPNSLPPCELQNPQSVLSIAVDEVTRAL